MYCLKLLLFLATIHAISTRSEIQLTTDDEEDLCKYKSFEMNFYSTLNMIEHKTVFPLIRHLIDNSPGRELSQLMNFLQRIERQWSILRFKP